MTQQSSFKVIIIVLNWNGGDDTLACLESIANVQYRDISTLVIDNGSTDNSLAQLNAYPAGFPLKVVATGKNLGFAGGNNVGIRHALEAGAEFVLLLNNDALIHPDAISRLVAAAEANPAAGVFSGKIFIGTAGDRLWYAGARWNESTQRFHHVGYGEHDAPCYSDSGATDYASGCAMFVRADLFRQIGLLDENFFLTYEETDFCYRARAAGHASMYVAEAVFRHKVSASFGGESTPLHEYFYARNLLLFGEKHFSRRRFARLFGRSLRQVAGLPEAFGRQLASPREGLWATNLAIKRLRGHASTPEQRARYLGLRDYVMRRFGDCPPEVRELNRRSVGKAHQ